jgi:hypothetical protein
MKVPVFVLGLCKAEWSQCLRERENPVCVLRCSVDDVGGGGRDMCACMLWGPYGGACSEVQRAQGGGHGLRLHETGPSRHPSVLRLGRRAYTARGLGAKQAPKWHQRKPSAQPCLWLRAAGDGPDCPRRSAAREWNGRPTRLCVGAPTAQRATYPPATLLSSTCTTHKPQQTRKPNSRSHGTRAMAAAPRIKYKSGRRPVGLSTRLQAAGQPRPDQGARSAAQSR